MRLLRILLVIGVVLLLISFVFVLIFGGKKDTTKTPPTTNTTSLTSAANTDATVTFLTDGIITSNDAHRQIGITISKTARTLTVYQGYQGAVLSTQSLVNNEQAYASFLNAIDVAGFTNQRAKITEANIAGQCPLGLRYIYSSTAIQNVPSSLWTSTCGRVNGTFGGNISTINNLFQLQIPNYTATVSTVRLYQ